MSFSSLFFVVLFSLALPRPAWACRALGPFDPAEKKLAEVVFEGEATAYERLASGEAKVTFTVRKTLRGERKKEWVLIHGSNMNAAPPASLPAFWEQYGKKNEVGFRRAESGLPRIVQGACNPPYVLRLK